MSDVDNHPKLVWLDLEMTGLDPDSERIIEIATIVTNFELNEVVEGPNLVIHQPNEFIENMDGQHRFFLSSDIGNFKKYKYDLDDQIINSKTTFFATGGHGRAPAAGRLHGQRRPD